MKIENYMKVIFLMIRDRVMENLINMVIKYMKVNGEMIKNMAMEMKQHK
jgi:hypothetical protein